MRAIASETKGATDCLASSVADFVKKLFVVKFRLRCDKEPSIMVVAEKVKAKMPDWVVADSEQRPRRTINSDSWRTTENSSIRHAESFARRESRRNRQSGHGWLEDTHVERVAQHRSEQRMTEI